VQGRSGVSPAARLAALRTAGLRVPGPVDGRGGPERLTDKQIDGVVAAAEHLLAIGLTPIIDTATLRQFVAGRPPRAGRRTAVRGMTTTEQGAALADIDLYLDTVLGDTEGYLHTAVGVGPSSPTPRPGKVEHKRWSPKVFRWPAEREQAVAHLLSEAGKNDSYMCPYVLTGWPRTQDTAASRTKAHADIDNGKADPVKIAELHGYAVASGSTGNAHAYVDLTRPVTAPEHKTLCRALGEYLGAKDSKIKDNDVLRPPCTLNHKSWARGEGDPKPDSLAGPARRLPVGTRGSRRRSWASPSPRGRPGRPELEDHQRRKGIGR